MSEKRYNGFSENDLRMVARKKVNFRMSVKIHFGVYLVVSTLLVIVNWYFTRNVYWFFYPIFGWLIGLAEHITAYLVYARGVYPMAKRGIMFHIVAFIFAMTYLFLINFATSLQYLWVLYPAIFWGTGLLIHLVVYVVYHRGAAEDQDGLKSRKERAIEKELEKMQKRLKKNNT
jgi:hypothetical protein